MIGWEGNNVDKLISIIRIRAWYVERPWFHKIRSLGNVKDASYVTNVLEWLISSWFGNLILLTTNKNIREGNLHPHIVQEVLNAVQIIFVKMTSFLNVHFDLVSTNSIRNSVKNVNSNPPITSDVQYLQDELPCVVSDRQTRSEDENIAWLIQHGRQCNWPVILKIHLI